MRNLVYFINKIIGCKVLGSVMNDDGFSLNTFNSSSLGFHLLMRLLKSWNKVRGPSVDPRVREIS